MKKINATFIVYVIAVLLMVVVTVSGSYAWFTANVNNNGTVYETIINSGSLSLAFENSQYFTVNDMIIISQEEVETSAPKSTFDVKNNGNKIAKYDLYFNTTLTNNLISHDFKWELLIGGEVVNSGDFSSITPAQTTSTSASIKLTNEPITINPDNTDSCVLRVWLQEEDYNQISLTEGSMTGNVSLTAVVG